MAKVTITFEDTDEGVVTVVDVNPPPASEDEEPTDAIRFAMVAIEALDCCEEISNIEE